MAQAWELIKDSGIPEVDVSNPTTFSVPDYTTQEKHEDEKAADWDMAYSEVE